MLLSLSQVNSIVENAVSLSKTTDTALFHILRVMQHFGLRANEAINLKTLLISENDMSIIISIPKTGTVRTLSKDSEIKESIAYLTKVIAPSQAYSVKNVQYFLLKIAGIKNLFIGEKQAISHIFRHAFAKRMFEKTRNVKQVAKIMGISEKVAKGYILSKIKVGSK